MIVRTAILSLAACAAALGALKFTTTPATSPPPVSQFQEMPLIGLPVVEAGRLVGLSFARVGLAGSTFGDLDPAIVRTFMADALYHAALGQPDGIAAGSRTVDPSRVRVAVRVRLERAGAPFVPTDIAFLQAEYRSRDRLRELAKAEAATDQEAGRR